MAQVTEPGLSSVLVAIQKALMSLTSRKIFIRVLLPFLVSAFLGMVSLMFFWKTLTESLVGTLTSIEWLNQSLRWLFSFFGGDGSAFLTFVMRFSLLLLDIFCSFRCVVATRVDAELDVLEI